MQLDRTLLKLRFLAAFANPPKEAVCPRSMPLDALQEAYEKLCSHFEEQGWPEDNKDLEVLVNMYRDGSIVVGYSANGPAKAWAKPPHKDAWEPLRPRLN
jgi:hypothetical protein